MTKFATCGSILLMISCICVYCMALISTIQETNVVIVTIMFFISIPRWSTVKPTAINIALVFFLGDISMLEQHSFDIQHHAAPTLELYMPFPNLLYNSIILPLKYYYHYYSNEVTGSELMYFSKHWFHMTNNTVDGPDKQWGKYRVHRHCDIYYFMITWYILFYDHVIHTISWSCDIYSFMIMWYLQFHVIMK
jgi:hypothetical protein